MRLAQAAAEDGEVLREDEDRPAVDRAAPGHDAVAGRLVFLHAKVAAAVRLEHVVLAEAAVVEQQREALTRRQLALLVLRLHPHRAAAQEGGSLLLGDALTHG